MLSNELPGRIAHVKTFFTEFFSTPTFSQINDMIDIALPIPRNINAGNKNERMYEKLTRNFYLCRSIPIQGPSIPAPRQIAQIFFCV